jgi:hypothetical protein
VVDEGECKDSIGSNQLNLAVSVLRNYGGDDLSNEDPKLETGATRVPDADHVPQPVVQH